MFKKIIPIILTTACGCTIDVGTTEYLNQPLPDGCYESTKLDCSRGYAIFCLYTSNPGPMCEQVWIRPDDVGYCCQYEN